MSKATAIYRIKVTNWNRYNSKIKPGHKATLISNNFCSDSKLGVLPLSHRWLFLGILLNCGSHTTDTVEMNERQLRDLLESSKSVERALSDLESIQVLTYEVLELNFSSFNKRKEKKVKEEKVIVPPPAEPPVSPSASEPPQEELIPDPFAWLVDLWNTSCPSLPPIKKITKGTKRFKSVTARLKEYPDPKTWLEIFTRFEASDFVTGRSGQWSGADFEWIMKNPEKIEKALRGGYDNPKPKEVKKDIWQEKAQRVLQAVAKYGDGDPNVREFLGEELWNEALKCDGGFYSIRRLPNQPWVPNKLAGLLKEAALKIKQQGEQI